MKRHEMKEDEAQGPFLKEKMSGLGCETLLNSKFQSGSFLNPEFQSPFVRSGGSTPRAIQHRAAAATCLSSSLLVPTSRTSVAASQSAISNSGTSRSVRISCKSSRSRGKRESLHVSSVQRTNFGTSSSVVPAASGGDAFDSSFLECESVQSRVSRVSAMLSPARHHTSVEHSSVARGGACGIARCCSCCGSGLVDGEGDICVTCISETHGCDMFNSCVEHGEGQVARRVYQGVGETKSKRTRTRSGVWQPLEGLMPVGDELATDPRRVSGKVHVETRDGCSSATMYGTRLVEFVEG